MEQPLGRAVGNALEVEEARQTLAGAEAPTDLFSLTVQAAGRLISLSDLDVDEQEGMRRAEQAIENGSALEAYERWIRAQGGDPALDVLPRAPIARDVTAEGEGYVTEVSAIGLGRAALELGAGRRTKDDAIDHAVGIRCFAKRGDSVSPGQLLAELHVRDEDAADWAAGQARMADTSGRPAAASEVHRPRDHRVARAGVTGSRDDPERPRAEARGAPIRPCRDQRLPPHPPA